MFFFCINCVLRFVIALSIFQTDIPSVPIAASSTTGPELASSERESSRIQSKDPSTWSVDDVIRYVKEADPQALAPHAELFRRHVGIFLVTNS